jgi:hypothetical protein
MVSGFQISRLNQSIVFPHFSDFFSENWWFDPRNQWIGLRENLQESPTFNGKIYGFL